LPLINEDGLLEISYALNKDDIGGKHFLSQIKKVTKQGVQIIGHLAILDDNKKIIEIDGVSNNVKLNGTMQFILNKKNDLDLDIEEKKLINKACIDCGETSRDCLIKGERVSSSGFNFFYF